jgi:hypothetical protein
MSITLTEQEALALARNGLRHGYWPKTHAGSLAEPNPSPWRAAAEQIISLVNLKDVASRAKGAEVFLKRVETVLEATINDVLLFPNPEDPGNPSFNAPIDWKIAWHWPGPNPGPLFVAAELNIYSKLVGGEKTIDGIIGRLAQSAGIRE